MKLDPLGFGLGFGLDIPKVTSHDAEPPFTVMVNSTRQREALGVLVVSVATAVSWFS